MTLCLTYIVLSFAVFCCEQLVFCKDFTFQKLKSHFIKSLQKGYSVKILCKIILEVCKCLVFPNKLIVSVFARCHIGLQNITRPIKVVRFVNLFHTLNVNGILYF